MPEITSIAFNPGVIDAGQVSELAVAAPDEQVVASARRRQADGTLAAEQTAVLSLHPNYVLTEAEAQVGDVVVSVSEGTLTPDPLRPGVFSWAR